MHDKYTLITLVIGLTIFLLLTEFRSLIWYMKELMELTLLDKICYILLLILFLIPTIGALWTI